MKFNFTSISSPVRRTWRIYASALALLSFPQGLAQASATHSGTCLDDKIAQRIADAIYRVEGGAKTKWPYGIKSVKTKNPRQICLNTIHNSFHRFQTQRLQAAPPEVRSRGLASDSALTVGFVYFLADRYCPPSADPLGNSRWKANMREILHLEK